MVEYSVSEFELLSRLHPNVAVVLETPVHGKGRGHEIDALQHRYCQGHLLSKLIEPKVLVGDNLAGILA